MKTKGDNNMHLLSEIKTTEKSHQAKNLIAYIYPIPGYDLPKMQMSFKLEIQNRSKSPLNIENPLETLQMLFTTKGSKIIEIPVRPPPALIHSVPPKREFSAPVIFISSSQDGKKVNSASPSYLIPPTSSVEIIFECKKIVGDQILDALSKNSEKEKSVYVLFTLSIIDSKNPNKSTVLRSRQIKLDMPKFSTEYTK